MESNYEAVRKNGLIMIFGYPEAKYNRMASLGHRVESVSQYWNGKEKAIQKVNKKRGEIVHICPAMKGYEGAPIVAVDVYKRIMVIGIHRGGLVNNGKCIGSIGRLMT